MNILIAKKAVIYSLILGAILALFGIIGFLIGLVAFALGLLCAPAVIFFMKSRNEIGFLDNQQGAALGAMVGFCSTVAYFAIFTPLVLLIHAIKPSYYSYGLPYIVSFDTFWLFLVIVVTIGILCALTNATTGMGAIFLLSQFDKKPDDIEEIYINIE